MGCRRGVSGLRAVGSGVGVNVKVDVDAGVKVGVGLDVLREDEGCWRMRGKS